jgi:hypothetical protein
MKKTIIITIFLLLLVYFIGVSLTGFVPLAETCCIGEDCIEDNECSFQNPQIPPQTNLNIVLEILALTLIVLYIIINLQQNKKNKNN